MTQAPTLETTLNLVDALFHGRLDKGGQLISHHTRRCVRNLPPATPLYVKLAMALHDVVEDTTLTLEDLADFGYGEDTILLVDVVTLRSHETYEEGIARLIGSQLFWALEMKLSDNKDNTDPERLGRLDADTRARMEKRYAGVRERLLEAMEDLDPQWVINHHPHDHQTC